MAIRYGIGSLDEARAYLAHPLLGSRLVECTGAVLAIEGRSLRAIFGSPDDLKFRSSMTLCSLAVDEGETVSQQALDRYFDGQADERKLALVQLRAESSSE